MWQYNVWMVLYNQQKTIPLSKKSAQGIDEFTIFSLIKYWILIPTQIYSIMGDIVPSFKQEVNPMS